MSTRWNYLAIEVKCSWGGAMKTDDIQTELTRQGQLGWELVTVTVPGPMHPAVLVFKKEA